MPEIADHRLIVGVIGGADPAWNLPEERVGHFFESVHAALRTVSNGLRRWHAGCPANGGGVMTDTGSEKTAGRRAEDVHHFEAIHVGGDAYAVDVRGHRFLVDQPVEAGGTDRAPTPTELFAASLATCVAFYAGRYLHRHDLPRKGLRVRTEFTMAADRPARVAVVRLVIVPPPELPEQRRSGLLAVASHCTVHNTLHQPPEIRIELATASTPRAPLKRGGQT
ncbi:OsmC family protein [Streptomyces sp. HUAS TT3]|uniref:OsmC family protein n=1 Tax=Streptomyces sp. HUAS TT3 TaxID=3447510 RepID=UPI003F657B46